MEKIGSIIILLMLLMLLNIAFKGLFDKKTKYKRELHYENNWFLLLFMFFGIFMFLFLKKIRQYRKYAYLENIYCNLKRHRLMNPNWQTEKFQKLDRYFKLKKLKKNLKMS